MKETHKSEREAMTLEKLLKLQEEMLAREVEESAQLRRMVVLFLFFFAGIILFTLQDSAPPNLNPMRSDSEFKNQLVRGTGHTSGTIVGVRLFMTIHSSSCCFIISSTKRDSHS